MIINRKILSSLRSFYYYYYPIPIFERQVINIERFKIFFILSGAYPPSPKMWSGYRKRIKAVICSSRLKWTDKVFPTLTGDLSIKKRENINFKSEKFGSFSDRTLSQIVLVYINEHQPNQTVTIDGSEKYLKIHSSKFFEYTLILPLCNNITQKKIIILSTSNRTICGLTHLNSTNSIKKFAEIEICIVYSGACK